MPTVIMFGLQTALVYAHCNLSLAWTCAVYLFICCTSVGVPTLNPAQYTGHADEAGVINVLKGDLKAMFERRFDANEYEQYDCKFVVQVSFPSGGMAGSTSLCSLPCCQGTDTVSVM